MTAPRAPTPADPAEHPLRASLSRGDAARALSTPALLHMLLARDRAFLDEAVVAHVGGMVADLARQLAELGEGSAESRAKLAERLLESSELRVHCHALALEWRLALWLEEERALDPVLSPLLQELVQDSSDAVSALAMAALSAQARFAQAQRRMELPLDELPAELYDMALRIAAEAIPSWDAASEAGLRAEYDEGIARLALLSRLADEGGTVPAAMLEIDQAGAPLWLSALAARSGQRREQVAFAASASELGRLLLTLRAAGVLPANAERQALVLHPDAVPPPGLHDIGIREAAQWLAEAQR